MGFFKIRRSLNVGGGSVQLGADVFIKRGAADRLDTDDAVQVSGTANLNAATRIGGALTQVGAAALQGSVTFSGTPVVMPYGTASPTLDVNGDLRIYHKSNVARVAFQSGGTSYVMALPTATAGTLTITVNSIP